MDSYGEHNAQTTTRVVGYVYSYFNKRCHKEALSLRNQTEREYG